MAGTLARLAACCALAALAGCAQYWDKPGATEAELRAADSACAVRASTRFPPMLHVVQTGGGYTMPAQGCSGGRNCHGRRAQWVPPTYSTVDRNQRLHVMFLTTPTMWAHYEIDTDGRVASRQIHQRGAVGDPQLITMGDGSVRVGNSIPYDLKAAAEARKKTRKASDRPAGTY